MHRRLFLFSGDSPKRGQLLPDQLLANKAELIRDLGVDCSDHILMEFTMMRRVKTLILGKKLSVIKQIGG